MNRMQKEQIHLECCPTSSIYTNAVKHRYWEKHPITIFKEYGINFGINSDDPGVFNVNYQGEVNIIRHKCGFSKWDVAKSWIRAAKASFLNENDKQKLVKEIENRIQVYYLQNLSGIVSKL